MGDRISAYNDFLKRGIPYLLVEHDVFSLRYSRNERNNRYDRRKIENACAVIFTSEDHAEYYENLGGKNGWHIPEYVVIHNRPLRKDMRFDKKKKLGNLHLVYAGGLSDERLNRIFSYRSYHLIFEKFIEAGWKVHIYPTKYGREQILRSYGRIGCIIHGWISGNKIFQEMSQYTAGFHGYNNIEVPYRAYKYTQLCRANKIYDYLAAGIPTIGYKGGNGMEIYRDKWGIVIDDLEPGTLKAIPERLEKIKITEEMRNDNVLDNERDKFEHIIKVALKEAGNKDRKRYYINENPFEVKDTAKYPSKIRVFNKGVITIYRGGYLFLPGETSGELTINMRTFKEIKSHVSLRIEHIK
ncbi:hypothetical protein ES705_43479 [subsurface metagenome]